MDVADRAQVLVGLVDREGGGQALAQQPGAASLGVAVRSRQPFGGVEAGESGTGELGLGRAARRREVGELAGTLGDTEVGAREGIDGDEVVDIGVGDLAGQPGAVVTVEGL
ncbi:hypothetical protein GCM10020254_18860 [Streptomyces goshikiensis]